MKEDFYIELIYKKLEGTISPPEKEKLDAWLEAAPANRITALGIETVWNKSDSLKATVDVDLEEEFSFLESKMEEEEPNQKETAPKVVSINPPKRSNFRWLAIAASLLLLAAAFFILSDTNEPNKPMANNEVLDWLMYTTTDSPETFTLPDQSVVHLNANTELHYPKEFDKEQRLVKLKRGETFFEVSHDKNHPFIVQTDYELVTVLGTSFNVNITKMDEIEVYVESGKVELRQRGSKRHTILNKLEKGMSTTRTGAVTNLGKQYTNDSAWHSKKLVFEDTPIEEVVAQINKFYGLQVFLSNNMVDCPFTASYDNEQISIILDEIKEVFQAQVIQHSPTQYLIKGSSCN